MSYMNLRDNERLGALAGHLEGNDNPCTNIVAGIQWWIKPSCSWRKVVVLGLGGGGLCLAHLFVPR